MSTIYLPFTASIINSKLFRALYIVMFIFFSIRSQAQVGISTTSITPDESSILEMRSTSKGMLIPRMTSAERDAITSPATGLMVYNTTTNSFNFYNGTTWLNIAGAGGITTITGVLNRTDISGTTSDPIIDISASYPGQNSITTLGTIGTGLWNGSIINPTYGGTGINNGTKTIILGGNLITSGDFTTTLNSIAPTNITLPVTGTLSTLAGVETFTNKTLNAPYIISPTGLVKADVGLANADNTSDANKPISTATQTALNLKLNASEKGSSNGVATLDATGKLPIAQMTVGPQLYKGTWNAATNTPAISDASGQRGDTYRVVANGTVNLGSGNVTFYTNDDAIHNGTIWQRNPATYAVTTVNGQTGTVVLNSDQVTEGSTNKYYTDARANLKLNVTDKGANNGVATLDGGGKIPVSQLPVGSQTYKGTWSAATNTPALLDATGSGGWTYRVTTSGTQNLGSGLIIFFAGDDVIHNGTIWQRSPSSATVNSVNGQTGNVVLNSDNISEGSTNLYLTNARVRNAVSANAPLAYNSSSGVFSIPQATSSVNGYLSYTDWVTFNQKQPAGNYISDPGSNGLLVRTSLNTTTFRSITGTANRLTVTNGDGQSGNPVLDISSNYSGQNSITTLGTISTGTWNGSTIGIGYGGTNSTSALNNNRIMVSTTGSIKEAAALTNGQLLIGSASAAPVAANITAGNGISITNAPGSITVSNEPTVLQTTGTTTLTTTSNSDVPMSTPLKITAPATGDYLIFFTGVVSNSNSGRGVIISLYINGAKIPVAETESTASGNDRNTATITYLATGVTAGQEFEMRWRAENNTATITKRILIAQRVK